MQTRTYFDFAYICGDTGVTPFYAKSQSLKWSDLFTDITATALDTTETITLLREYIYPKFYNAYVMYCDSYGYGPTDPDAADILKAKNDFLGRLYSWLFQSKDTYKLKIDLYNKTLAQLEEGVKSSSTTRFNDTPQTSSVTGHIDNTHTSNITLQEAVSAAGTPIERMDEIRRLLVNIYALWASEFEKFVYGA